MSRQDKAVVAIAIGLLALAVMIFREEQAAEINHLATAIIELQIIEVDRILEGNPHIPIAIRERALATRDSVAASIGWPDSAPGAMELIGRKAGR